MRRRDRISSAEIGPRSGGRSTASNSNPRGSIQTPRNGRNENTPPKMQISAKGKRTGRQMSRRIAANGRRNNGTRRDNASNCR